MPGCRERTAAEDAECARIDALLRKRPPRDAAAAHARMTALRRAVLHAGLPPQTPAELAAVASRASLRGRAWKALLCVGGDVRSDAYIEAVRLGPQPLVAGKIDADRRRTFHRNAAFRAAVLSGDRHVRLLNAFAHRALRSNIGSSGSSGSSLIVGGNRAAAAALAPAGYVQGMNLVAGMLLYVLPEPDALACFEAIALRELPLYFAAGIPGALQGAALAVRCLGAVDAELHAFMAKAGLRPEIINHLVISLGAATPPMQEALHVWDWLLAFGLHLAPLVAVAQLVLMRSVLFASQSPCSLLRTFPPLRAAPTVRLLNHFAAALPQDLFDMLAVHGRVLLDLSSNP